MVLILFYQLYPWIDLKVKMYTITKVENCMKNEIEDDNV